VNSVACPQCATSLPAASRGIVELVRCPGCRREVSLCALPVLDRPVARAPLAAAAGSGESTCYFCPDKRAVSVCHSCGSFTCVSCEVEWFGEHLCLACVHALREVKNDIRFRSRSTLHDNIALMLLVLPILLIPFYGFFFALLLSPVSLFMVIRYRKASRGIVPRGPFRLIAAGSLAILLVLSGVAMIGAMTWAIANATSELGDVEFLPDDAGPLEPATQ
jgi:hypothetical protein